MSLNIISTRSTPIAFAYLAFFIGIPASASAGGVVFPASEWSEGLLTVLGGKGSPLKFFGPEHGLPSETLTLADPGGSAELFGSLVPHPAISASVSATTTQANAKQRFFE
jgi:hypothetical protein